MFLDALLQFDPAGTAITVTADSTNVLDLLNQRDLNPGSGYLMDLLCEITTTFTAGGAATLQVSIKGAVDNGSGAEGTYYVFVQTDALPVANLTVGRQILETPLPSKQPTASNVTTPPRFLKLTYTVATGPMTAGKVASYLIPHGGRQSNHQYPAGFTPSN